MNSLMSYGSDDDSNDSGDERYPEMPGRQNVSKNYRRPAAHEDNYEEVGMDMSEDSDESSGPPSKNREESRHNPTFRADRLSNASHTRRSEFPPPSGHTSSYSQQSERRSGSKSPKNRKEEDERRNNRSEDRGREDRYRTEDKYRRRDSRDDERSKDRERTTREDDKGRDRDRDRYRDDRRDRRDRDDRYSRDRRDRDRKRSRSRDRRRSRSPRRTSRSPRRTSRSPRRSRSGSRERGSKVYLSRREKADKRMDRLDKLGIQFKPDNYPASAIQDAENNLKNPSGSNGGNRFFMPGITGRFREQIEKRKQLWQKAKEQDAAGPSTSAPAPAGIPAGGSKATKVYEATTFSDDKTSSKFKRLMGIKDTDTESLPVKATDVLKKQQEMFSSMEAQYEVARTATHTMRGVGLGFGSFQR